MGKRKYACQEEAEELDFLHWKWHYKLRFAQSWDKGRLERRGRGKDSALEATAKISNDICMSNLMSQGRGTQTFKLLLFDEITLMQEPNSWAYQPSFWDLTYANPIYQEE